MLNLVWDVEKWEPPGVQISTAILESNLAVFHHLVDKITWTEQLYSWVYNQQLILTQAHKATQKEILHCSIVFGGWQVDSLEFYIAGGVDREHVSEYFASIRNNGLNVSNMN